MITKNFKDLRKFKPRKPFVPFKFAPEMDEHMTAVMEDVRRQMQEELGDEEENPVTGKERNALMQKYGLTNIMFTNAETNLMRRQV